MARPVAVVADHVPPAAPADHAPRLEPAGGRLVDLGHPVAEGDRPAVAGRRGQRAERRVDGDHRLDPEGGLRVHLDAGGTQLGQPGRGGGGQPGVLPEPGGDADRGGLVRLEDDVGQRVLPVGDAVAGLVVEDAGGAGLQRARPARAARPCPARTCAGRPRGRAGPRGRARSRGRSRRSARRSGTVAWTAGRSPGSPGARCGSATRQATLAARTPVAVAGTPDGYSSTIKGKDAAVTPADADDQTPVGLAAARAARPGQPAQPRSERERRHGHPGRRGQPRDRRGQAGRRPDLRLGGDAVRGGPLVRRHVTEVFLFVALRRGGKPADEEHPFGYGKESFVWAFIAALFTFVGGAGFSIYHGITTIVADEQTGDFLWSYVVLAVSFVAEGTSFLRAQRQVAGESRRWGITRVAVPAADPGHHGQGGLLRGLGRPGRPGPGRARAWG